MSTISSNLSLPYIQANQAQKHVTHNEGIRVLDSLTQLSVISAVETAPPAAPNPGDRYIVAASATGIWAGQEGTVAVWDENAWRFFPAQTGWVAWDENAAAQVVWDGAIWGPAVAPLDLQNVDMVGINTTADITNRLAVASDATLFSHDASGDHHLKINRDTDINTASLLFQTGWTGYAEMGLTGTDNLSMKVSTDGSAWKTTMKADAETGVASFPSGLDSEQFRINFQEVYTLTPPAKGGMMILSLVDAGYPQGPANAIFVFDVGSSPLLTTVWLGSRVSNMGTTTLTGTTGTPTYLSVGLKGDGNIYIENQYHTSGTRQFSVTFLNAFRTID